MSLSTGDPLLTFEVPLHPWNDGSGDYPSILSVDLIVSTLVEVKTKNGGSTHSIGPLAWRLPSVAMP
jgi:hypothetical protein